MEPNKLIEHLFQHSGELHPLYTHEQHKLWTMGFLASIVCEKNRIDNVIWAQIKYKLEQAHNPTVKQSIIRTQQRIQ